ncbi:MAG: hypothetical protein OEW64_07850 [Gammaproteobacteria bacterium]|nr:hypothetical protein [Gammaproteobacteria bacterium]MDH5303996.1 hypothetical protein [Gammaproteobacteria bacterium]MDH5321946.1 hypothetical protein [Gammaproteobacteria bacterium]
MSYHVDQFHAAVSVLAGHGHIKQRLIKAYGQYLESIDEDELPDAVRETFVELQRSLHRVAPLNGEGPVCASVRKMSAEDAGDCAVSIVAMYRSMIGYAGSVEPGLALGQENRTAVPPFLIKSV